MNIAVVLNYKNYKRTIETIKNLVKSGIDIVVMVDNYSPNASFEILKSNFKKNKNIFAIQSQNNLGYAQGNNLGLQFIEKKIGINEKNVIFVVNPDVIVNKSLVDAAVQFIYSHPNSGAVTSLMNNTMQSAWHHITLSRAVIFNPILFSLIFSKLFKITERKKYKPNNQKSMKVDVTIGAFFAISQKHFKQVGYFDPNTFLYYEEEILFSKLKESKLQNYILLNENFFHIGGESTKNLNLVNMQKISNESKLYLLKNYYNANNLYIYLMNKQNNIDYRVLPILKKLIKVFEMNKIP